MEADNFSVIMKNTVKLSVVLVLLLVSLVILAQAPPPATPRFTPVTQKMLENPSPDDWLMFSRTYDAQRYSPL
jgi:glucose dehydrogenase